jgi:hypothetical protein
VLATIVLLAVAAAIAWQAAQGPGVPTWGSQQNHKQLEDDESDKQTIDASSEGISPEDRRRLDELLRERTSNRK